MDIFIVFLVFVCGYATGWFRASKHMLERMLDKPELMMQLLKKYKEAKDEDDTAPSSDVRSIDIQKENGAFYLYARDNGEFLGQGTTLDQALEVVAERFPGQNFAGHVDADEAKLMGLSK